VESIINYENGREPSADITCYVNFEIPILVNIYDDRGMNVISPDKSFASKLKKKFFNLSSVISLEVKIKPTE